MSIETQAKPRRSLRDLFGPNATEGAKAITRRAAKLSMNDMAKVLNTDNDKGAAEDLVECGMLSVPASQPSRELYDIQCMTAPQQLGALSNKALAAYVHRLRQLTPIKTHNVSCMVFQNDEGSFHPDYLGVQNLWTTRLDSCRENAENMVASFALMNELNAVLTQLGQRNITPDVTVRFRDPLSAEEGELSFGPHAPVGSYFGGSVDYGVQVQPEFHPGFFKR